MDCPRCKVPMATKEIGDVKIDECPQCRGMWFDQGEFQAAKEQVDPDLNWLAFDIWKHKKQFQVSAHPLKCPNDGAPMVVVDYGDTGVAIDVCPTCRGIWLEQGEFAKIITALQQELETKDVSDYVKASLEEAGELVTDPENFASEWKDFTTVLRLLQYRLFAEKPRLLTELIEGQKGAPIW
jgi:Zn-finger nucleic acid-binding protein